MIYINIPDGMDVLMHDLNTDLYYDLRKQNFSITLPAGIMKIVLR